MNTSSEPSIASTVDTLLAGLGVPRSAYQGGQLPVHSPITGELIASVHEATADQAAETIAAAHRAFLTWREVPAPRRGELVRLLGEELRAAKQTLGELVTL